MTYCAGRKQRHRELLDHRPRIGAHSAPPGKCLRCLLDQHADAIATAFDARITREVQERRQPLAIGEFVNKRGFAKRFLEPAGARHGDLPRWH